MLEFLTTNIWVIATAIVAFTTVITQIINEKLNPNGVWKQVVSWVVAIALTVGTYFLGTYEYAGSPWISVPLTGLVVGLVSNGVYDIPTFQGWIKGLAGFFFTKE